MLVDQKNYVSLMYLSLWNFYVNYVSLPEDQRVNYGQLYTLTLDLAMKLDTFSH